MRKAGVEAKVRIRISGHKTLQMDERYDKIDMDDLREAVNKTATFTATKREEALARRSANPCETRPAPVAQEDRASDS